MSSYALKDLESWQSKGNRDMEALRPLERAMDVPYFRRDDMRTEFLGLLRAGVSKSMNLQ